MGARQKLNTIYLGAAALIAGFAALTLKSTMVFIICLAGLVTALYQDRSFRPKAIKRR